jgi:hypothetical protein
VRGQGVPVLITTREYEIAAEIDAAQLEITPLDHLDAQELVRAVSKLDESSLVTEFATKTNGNPLFIQTLGGQLRARRPERRRAFASKLLKKLSPAQLLDLGVQGQALRQVLAQSYSLLSKDAQRAFLFLGMFSPSPFPKEKLAALLELEGDALDEVMDELLTLKLVEDAEGGAYRLPELPYALAKELVSQDTDLDNKIKHILARRSMLEPDPTVSTLEEHARGVAHFMSFFELLKSLSRWQDLNHWTDVDKRAISVTGRFHEGHSTIIDAVLTLASFDAAFERTYFRDVDLRGIHATDLYLTDSFLTDVDMSGSRIGDLYFTNSVLSDIDMRGCQLGDIYLTNSVVLDLDLRGARCGTLYLEASRVARLLFDGSPKDIYLEKSSVFADWGETNVDYHIHNDKTSNIISPNNEIVRGDYIHHGGPDRV